MDQLRRSPGAWGCAGQCLHMHEFGRRCRKAVCSAEHFIGLMQPMEKSLVWKGIFISAECSNDESACHCSASYLPYLSVPGLAVCPDSCLCPVLAPTCSWWDLSHRWICSSAWHHCPPGVCHPSSILAWKVWLEEHMGKQKKHTFILKCTGSIAMYWFYFTTTGKNSKVRESQDNKYLRVSDALHCNVYFLVFSVK